MRGKFICGWLALIMCMTLGIEMNDAARASEKPRDYPNRLITLLVGFSAGGNTDVGARITAESMRKMIGQAVVVENKAGAGSQVMLTDFKNRAKPDGYTMALINVPHILTIIFDPDRKATFGIKDLQPVANEILDPGIIMVGKDSSFKSIEDFIAAARDKPGQIRVAFGGLLGDDHLALLDLQRKTGLRFREVNLPGSAEVKNALLGGHADVGFDNVGGTLPMVLHGEMRYLAVMLDSRYSETPNVPTLKEKGIEVISSSARGYVMPAGTPMGIVKYVESVIKKCMEDQDYQKRMKNAGLDLKFMGTEEYSTFLEVESNRAKYLVDIFRK